MAPADGASQAEDRMTFTAGQPENGQSLGASKVPIRDNFTAIVADLAVNHIGINLADQGKHNFVEMPVRTTPTILASEGAIYTRTQESQSQLCYTNDATGNQYPLTRIGTVGEFASFGTTPDGWVFLPGRILLQYGSVATPGTSGTITLPRVFSSTNYIIQLTLQRSSAGQTAVVDNGTPPTTTDFNYRNSSAGSDFLFWIAIGF